MTDILLPLAAADAIREAAGARAKFPGNRHMLAALMEEVGELAQSLLEQGRGSMSADDVYAEAIQVAAMALRIAVEGSLEFPDYKPSAAQSRGFKPTSPKPKIEPIGRSPSDASGLYRRLADVPPFIHPTAGGATISSDGGLLYNAPSPEPRVAAENSGLTIDQVCRVHYANAAEVPVTQRTPDIQNVPTSAVLSQGS